MARKAFLRFTLLLLILSSIADVGAARTFRISCDSLRGRIGRCPVNARRARVSLIRTRSSTPCRDNWEYRNGEIVVRNGCRGDFEVRADGSGEDDDRYRSFRDVPGIGKFIVDRQSYYDSRRIREFDAIVNGSRERWWANCRSGDEIGTGSRRVRGSRATERIVRFVCNDERY
jgi:hypothetical protein